MRLFETFFLSITSLVLRRSLGEGHCASAIDADVIVIGGGLAGHAAALAAEEGGARVLLLEKEAKTGGNSAKASSGINGAATAPQSAIGAEDSVEAFAKDTMWSATRETGAPTNDLVKVLAESSSAAIAWLTGHGVDLSVVSKCGGHSAPRTHRSAKGNVGWNIVSKMQAIVKEREKITVRVNSTVSELRSGGVIVLKDGKELRAATIVLASGGFAANQEMVKKYRPDLVGMPTTNGPWAQGQGVALASALGAQPVGMDQIQVHPTGFVNPKKPDDPTKVLCAEAVRAAGGVLINSMGERFTSELGLRQDVVDAMNAGKGPFRIVLSRKSADTLTAHMGFYKGTGLLKEYENAKAMAKELGFEAGRFEKSIEAYNDKSEDFKTKSWPGAPFDQEDKVYAGIVTPVLHYTMGGIKIDVDAQILDASGSPITGLFAAGEVSGGVHGRNRLAGNSLLETVVFGKRAGHSAMTAAAACKAKGVNSEL